MRNIFEIIILIILVSCQNQENKINYFRNMTHLPNFDFIKNKSILKGFDRIYIEPSRHKINGIPCWYLSSPNEALLNIRGYIWKEDSLIYIKIVDRESNDFDKVKKQMLFNFGRTKSSWTVDYTRENKTIIWKIFSDSIYYNKSNFDTIVSFGLERQYETSIGFKVGWRLQVSLKQGFSGFGYFHRNDSIYFIEYLPKENLLKWKDSGCQLE